MSVQIPDPYINQHGILIPSIDISTPLQHLRTVELSSRLEKRFGYYM